MLIDLPQTGAPMLQITIYSPAGIMNINTTAEYNTTLEVPDKTYLVVVESMDTAKRVYGTWGFDRTQWLPFKPEYHNAKRLAPKPKPAPKRELPKQESDDGVNSQQNDLPAEKPLD